ncbi:MAG: EAL domain-containing protein [Holophagales bacterium]|nr:EAL domain-containing protein [Holophagales bacterium]
MSEWGDTSRLQADLLKMYGHLFDAQTRLPSLAPVLDDVRRRIEEGDALGLIYLDLASGGDSERDRGWELHDQLILAAAAALRRARDELFEPGDLLAQLAVRADQFLCFVGHGNGRPLEDLHGLVVARVEEGLCKLFQPENAPPPVLVSAAVTIRGEPRMRIERSIYGAIARARQICRRRHEVRHTGQRAELARMLDAGDVVIRYQPIVELESGRVHGFEALCGAPDVAAFESPESLFRFAEESEHIVELERLCRTRALGRIGPLLGGGPRLLFLNCSAHAFRDSRLRDDLTRGLAEEAELGGVVLEITERVAITAWRDLRRVLEEIRAAGVLVAIDDVGAGYSSLRAVGEIEPDYLKLDFSLVQDLHKSAIKRDLFATLATLARKIGAQAIAEGIEVPGEMAVVRDHGVALGQGYLFARPAEPAELGPVHFPG